MRVTLVDGVLKFYFSLDEVYPLPLNHIQCHIQIIFKSIITSSAGPTVSIEEAVV